MPLASAGFDDPATGKADGRSLLGYGPTLQVAVSHFVQDGVTDQLPTEMVHALVDTGATESCIDSKLAEDLGLPAIDAMEMAGVGGIASHKVYLASVHIPELEFGQFGRFAGVDLSDGGQIHRALLGRTFLQNVILIYDGLRAQVTLAAR